MDVCLSWVSRFVRWRSLRRADHSSRADLWSVACLSVIVKPRKWQPWPGIGSKRHRKKRKILCVSEKGGFSFQLILRDFSMHVRHEKDIKHFDRNAACQETALNNSAMMEDDI